MGRFPAPVLSKDISLPKREVNNEVFFTLLKADY